MTMLPNRIMAQWNIRWLFLACWLIVAITSTAFARDCWKCGTKGLPDLAMICPKCGESLLTPQSRRAERASAVLVTEIWFVGDNPKRLPVYGKLFINDIYRGNLELSEKEARSSSSPGKNSSPGSPRRGGLGSEFTGLYKGEWRNLDIGQVKVRIEMKFRRAYGLLRSAKSILFPFVLLKSGEKTVLRYTFASARQFGRPENKAKVRQPPDKNAPRVVVGTGTIGVEIPAIP